MSFTSYFVKHPVIAIVINCLIAFLGMVCLASLTVREYPNISFPTISVYASYPNASPELVETSVTNVLEDQLAGTEGLETITSNTSKERAYITMKFRPDVSMDRAFSATQDAVSKAQSRLPSAVRQPAVERQQKTSGLPFIGIALESDSRDVGNLTHFANLHLKNVFRSIPGVSSVEVWGQPYIYNIHLRPEKLFSFGINAHEVIDAIANRGAAMPAGRYQNTIPVTVNSKLKSQDDFESLIVKDDPKHPVDLKSLADVKLKTDKNKFRIRVNGHPGMVLAINRSNDANPIDVAHHVRQQLNELKRTLPQDLKANVIIDQSEFINASLKNVRSAIVEAILLVLIIVFIFLRNLRATLIPLVTIPISLLGSILFLKFFGFSINLMTLLAMVLAIGLVVDDAIIVLENIWRHMEQGSNPLEAAVKGAQEIGFAVLAMTFTLTAVYLPIAFIQGMIGQLFIEFAVALAGSVIISGIVALTLSPLMCSALLKKDSKHWWPRVDNALSWLASRYQQALLGLFNYQIITLCMAAFIFASSIFLYSHMEHETAPKEDRSLIGVYTPQVIGEDIDALDQKTSQLEKPIFQLQEAKNRLTFIGEWGANIILPLKSHKDRSRSSKDIVESLRPSYQLYPSVDPRVWSWDVGLPGLNNAGNGTELSLVISSTDDFREVLTHVGQLKAVLEEQKIFASVNFDLRLDSMGYKIDFDYPAMAKLGLNPALVAKSIEIFFSSDKSQDFEKDGIVYPIKVHSKRLPWTLDELYITNPKGKRISIGAIARMQPNSQPASLEHFQQMRSTTLRVQLNKGQSMAQGSEALWRIAKDHLPNHYKLTWTGAAKTNLESSHTMMFLLILSIILIYAVLSMQFENFIDPFIILITVPLAGFGALLLTYCCGLTINVYTQIGLITLMGLIAKHGILIVEFANQLSMKGLSPIKSVQQAAVLRLRPILMTTGAMLFGAVPLVLSSDAGAESRQAIGTVLIGGLLIGTVFTLFVLPVVYGVVKQIRKPARICSASE